MTGVMEAALVLLETSGNQGYIFGSNKLAENVGASELTYRAGTEHVLWGAGRPDLWHADPAILRRNLLDAGLNPPLGAPPGHGIEVIVCASGKALLLVGPEDVAGGRESALEHGRRIVARTTERVLEFAPGVSCHGAVVPVSLGNESLHLAINAAHEAHAALRSQLSGPEARFPRLPVVAPCATSGLPAWHEDDRLPEQEVGDPVGARLRSAVAAAKRRMRGAGLDRLRRAATRDASFALEDGTDDLLDQVDWAAVIHADGNGVGQIFQAFDTAADAASPARWRDYVARMRRFSIALDICGEAALQGALAGVAARGSSGRPLPVLPLVLGGDDLTVVCDGRIGVRLAHDFLARFEAETAIVDRPLVGGILPEVARRQFGVGRLGACAGIAIVKPHFPFHLAYGLSDALLRRAKVVKRLVCSNGRPLPCSALDFHVHYDASGADLDAIRAGLTVDGGATLLVGRPYVVTPADSLDSADAAGRAWAAAHAWAPLAAAVDRFRETLSGDEEERLPRTLAEALRASLFRGRAVAEARLDLERWRYRDRGLDDLLTLLAGREPAPPLFRPDPVGGHAITGWLDLLDLAEMWS